MNISKGHIYIISYNLNPHIMYIGSTFNELKYRWRGHKAFYNNKPRRNNYSIHEYFDKYGIENFTLKLLKSYDVYREHNKDNKHLKAYETLWINKLKCVNIKLPFQPLQKERKKQYRQTIERQIIMKEYRKKYSQKPEVKEKKRIASITPEARERKRIAYQSPEGKLKKKEYQQLPEVKERRKQYQKEYREKNKTIIAEKRKHREKKKENKPNKVT